MKQRIDLPIHDPQIIAQLIPHRAPMVLVDGLMAFDEISAVTSFKVAEDHIATIRGAISETGLLEHMAQSVAVHTGYKGFSEGKTPRIGYVGAIKTAEIKHLPTVGETIMTEVTITYSAMEMTMVTVVSKVEELVIASAEMSTMLKPLDT
ncbi:MAG: hypothetical protein R3359_07070 [Marinirhabdus sp.]|nr:hypothetical protein [Marinirhabdus sp.]